VASAGRIGAGAAAVPPAKEGGIMSKASARRAVEPFLAADVMALFARPAHRLA
jgi:hypothetical protein